MSDSVGLTSSSRTSIVEQILEQGQRLRTAMVKSILDNDPSYVDESGRSSKSVESQRKRKKKPVTGDNYGRCTCEVCTKYRQLGYQDDLNSSPCLYLHQKLNHLISSGIVTESEQEGGKHLSEAITKSIQDCYRAKAVEYLKYVNSMKITIHSLVLNQAGNRKACFSSVNAKYKLPTGVNCSYFVEYSVPDFLVNTQQKIGAKVDTGLSGNLFRICSKRLQQEEIFFKHTSIHDIVNLLNLNSRNIELKFQVSSRTVKQKTTNVLGYATFNLDSFETTKHLCCTHSFPVTSDGLVMGSLKMTLQLGCGRMYFGKEFVEFIITNSKIDPISSQRSDSQVTFDDTPKFSVISRSENGKAVPYNRLKEKQTKQSDVTFSQLSRSLETSGARETMSSYRSQFKTSDVPSLTSAKVKDNTFSVPNRSLNTTEARDSLPSYRSGRSLTNADSKKNSLGEQSVEPMRSLNSAQTKETRYRSDVRTAEAFRQPLPRGKEAQMRGLVSAEAKENADASNILPGAVNAKHDNKLLYGLLYISEVRYYNDDPVDSYIICQVFGQSETEFSRIVYNSIHPVFNFYQKVPFLYNEDFLNCMRDNSIAVEVWERKQDEDLAFGTVELPLHQFYVSYKNKDIVDNLLENDLPVVLVDGWERFSSPIDGILDGQMKILIALGTQAQIHNLEVKKGLKDSSNAVTYISVDSNGKQIKELAKGAPKKLNKEPTPRLIKRPPYLAKTLKTAKRIPPGVPEKPKPKTPTSARGKIDVGVQSDNMETPGRQQLKVHAMLESFLNQLTEQKRHTVVESATNTEALVSNSLTQLSESKEETDTQLRKTSDLLDSLSEALSCNTTFQEPQDPSTFKAHIVVEGALHLPTKRRCRSRRPKRKNIPFEDTLPSTYVTFETVGAPLKVTPVAPKSTNPNWDFRSDVFLPGETLTNAQKRLLFKVWRKCSGSSPNPNMQTDIVLGFAALDLTVILAGLPAVQGWFNIVDFSGKCNGQIKIHVTPLENISRFNPNPQPLTSISNENFIKKVSLKTPKPTEVPQESSELLGRALKRKFTELEEITQRLRVRLADVTKDDSDTSNDEFSNDFEKDINTLCVEEDYNMIDFTQPEKPQNWHHHSLLQEVFNPVPPTSAPFAVTKSTDSAYCSTQADFAKESSGTSSSSESQIRIETPTRVLTNEDRQLIAGKQHIDTLLEKLSLLTGTDDCFSNRYVSGCSVSQASEINKNVPKETLNLDEILNSSLFNQLCNANPSVNEPLESQNSECSGSSCSSDKYISYRHAPDGAGNAGSISYNTNKDV